MVLFQFDLPLTTSNLLRESYKDYLISYPKDSFDSYNDVSNRIDYLEKYSYIYNTLCKSYIFRALFLYRKNNGYYNSDFDYYVNSYKERAWSSWGVEIDTIPLEKSISLMKEMQVNLSEEHIKFYSFKYKF